MKKSSGKTRVLLFSLRLFFYLSVLTLIAMHPSITISFDRIGIIQWFIIIPLEAIIAFLPVRKNPLRNKCIGAGIAAVLFSLLAGGFTTGALPPFFAGVMSFLLTYLLFNQSVSLQPLWKKLSTLEPFFFAWICLRLLALSRSSEDLAGLSFALTQFVLVWTALVFLLHSVVVYVCVYPKSSVGAKKEGALFFAGAAAALVLTLAILPPDFVRNTVVKNLNTEEVPEKIKDSELGIPKDLGGRIERRRAAPRNGNESRQELLGQRNWQSITGRSGRGNGSSQDNKQYMVMVVASEQEPVYMGESFRGQFDPVQGFQVSPQEPLNNISKQRFFVTWFNNEPNRDKGRERREVFSLSTLPRNFLPWQPVSIDPTILSENSGPLRYIHQVAADTHSGDPLQLVTTPSRSLSDFEKHVLAPYLELPLENADKDAFDVYMNGAVKHWQSNRGEIISGNPYLNSLFYGSKEETETIEENEIEEDDLLPPPQVNEHLEKILALLVSFSTYQYNLSYNDDYSVAALKEFLFNSAEGDCVEFSNTFALLGRLAGIPSRVVTGYLAAESLQTQAHLRGLANLREHIEVLRQFPFNNLFMVTNLHSHSWTQFYIPDYGWLDFEATSFAVPPEGTGDFNSWDVVIPIIDENRLVAQVRQFPWRAVLRAAAFMLVFALTAAYALRYGREAFLSFGARRGGRDGARALYLLLLARLAADGKPIKPASKTALEYTSLFPGSMEDSHFQSFASLYSELRWREFLDKAQEDERFTRLRQEYFNILKTYRRKGFINSIKRFISLRGLAYL